MLSVRDLLTKAIRASSSAALLLDDGDINGACNRAYYAMFDAARAALLASGAPVDPNVVRTHNGVIAAFGLHLVKTGRVLPDWGRTLNRAQEIRQAADYTGDSVDLELATWVVEQSRLFLQALQADFQIDASGPAEKVGSAPRP
ncbi:HEPN domain protein [Caballeronia pedi]|uniref:HEPN domain protein n=1 Tax=Caballeronia pedi TaxID=1777141 RepID=A0A158DTP8_9BURK|nr:HEPN domain-containing protein [Caballeronia pedi]SAK97087.1 HEPN domain protein [Caballeronia pedi]